MNPKSAKELLFLPLGGAGEIGMNLNLYGYGGQWLMVDLGVTFGDDAVPGTDVMMPDPSFIAERREDLLGIVLTHGHEDHLGAVAYLWPRLRCPVWATPFTAALLRGKLQEANLIGKVKLTEVPMKGRFSVGPFDIELISLTHSIPEPNAVAIRTPAGTVLHTGDWKFDPDPLIGETADEKALRDLGEEGVLALVGDSTNVFVEGHSGSEADVRKSLTDLIGRYKQKIAIGCFASNVARLESIALAAKAHGRHVALVGRSLWRIDEAARANGYLCDLPPFLTDQDASRLPEDKVLYLCTGSQGESRAALRRIADDNHPFVKLEPGDVVIFSSRVIPGNEREIGHLQNKLARLGVEIITDKDHFVHVSGHPAQEELVRMYQLAKPKIAVPVHGEGRHLVAHAELARSCQVPEAVVVENGSLLRLAPGPAEIIDTVKSGRLAVDGDRLVPMDSALMRERQRMVYNGGSAVATLVLDRKGHLVGDPQLSALGLIDPEQDPDRYDDILDAIVDAVEELRGRDRQNDDAVKEAVRLAVRRTLRDMLGKKPTTQVHLVRI